MTPQSFAPDPRFIADSVSPPSRPITTITNEISSACGTVNGVTHDTCLRMRPACFEPDPSRILHQPGLGMWVVPALSAAHTGTGFAEARLRRGVSHNGAINKLTHIRKGARLET